MRHPYYILLPLLVIALVFSGCQKEDFSLTYRERGDDYFPYPTIALELQKTAYDRATAVSTLRNFTALDVRTVGFCVGSGIVPEVGAENCTDLAWTGDTVFSADLRFPELDSTYLVRPYARLSDDRILYGNVVSFLTTGFVITTSQFPNFRPDKSIVITGFIEQLAEEVVIEQHGHVWSTEPGIESLSDGDTTALGPYTAGDPFTSTLTAIESGTTYYVRAYARVGERVYFGNTTSFEARGWSPLLAATAGPPPRIFGSSFTIDGKLYIGGGIFYTGDITELFDLDGDIGDLAALQILTKLAFRDDFWEYDPATQTWTELPSIPDGGRIGAVAFSHGEYGYMGMGLQLRPQLVPEPTVAQVTPPDLYRFDPATRTWEDISASVPPEFAGRYGAVTFTTDAAVYLGLGATGDGSDKTELSDFWRFDPLAENWTQKADFAGGTRLFPVGFAVGGRGYVGLGDRSFDNRFFLRFEPVDDLWAYDPDLDAWTPRKPFPGGERNFSYGFAIGERAFVGSGVRSIELREDDLWEYLPAEDFWLERPASAFPDGERAFGTIVANDERAFFGGGAAPDATDDITWPLEWWTFLPFR